MTSNSNIKEQAITNHLGYKSRNNYSRHLLT